MFAFTWQSLHMVVAKPAAVGTAVGHPGFAVPFFSMKFAADPCGPCAAGDPASVLWQSVQDMVWVPMFTFHGATICAAARGFGVVLPLKLFREARTGCPDLFSGLNSIATSVSTGLVIVPFADRPLGGAPAPQ